MTFANNIRHQETLRAGEDLRTKQFHFVKKTTAGKVVACDVAGELAYGVLLNKPDNGGNAIVVRAGAG